MPCQIFTISEYSAWPYRHIAISSPIVHEYEFCALNCKFLFIWMVLLGALLFVSTFFFLHLLLLLIYPSFWCHLFLPFFLVSPLQWGLDSQLMMAYCSSIVNILVVNRQSEAVGLSALVWIRALGPHVEWSKVTFPRLDNSLFHRKRKFSICLWRSAVTVCIPHSRFD